MAGTLVMLLVILHTLFVMNISFLEVTDILEVVPQAHIPFLISQITSIFILNSPSMQLTVGIMKSILLKLMERKS